MISVPNYDSNATLIGYIAARTVGSYNPADSFSIYLDQATGGQENNWEAYWHERTHLQLYTSTAFGHVQQIFCSLCQEYRKHGMPDAALAMFDKYASLLYQSSWEVQEGAATITPYLYKNPFSLVLIRPGFYSHLPQRYADAATFLSSAVGALLSPSLAQFGYVAVNAVAQFCLNTEILRFSTEFLLSFESQSQGNSFAIFDHLADGKNHPQNRLNKLISALYDDESNSIPHAIQISFAERLMKLDFVNVGDNGEIIINGKTQEKELLIQDILNLCIMDALQNILPEYVVYKRVIEMEEDVSAFFSSIESSGFGGVSHNNISRNLKKRAEFKPVVKSL